VVCWAIGGAGGGDGGGDGGDEGGEGGWVASINLVGGDGDSVVVVKALTALQAL